MRGEERRKRTREEEEREERERVGGKRGEGEEMKERALDREGEKTTVKSQIMKNNFQNIYPNINIVLLTYTELLSHSKATFVLIFY